MELDYLGEEPCWHRASGAALELGMDARLGDIVGLMTVLGTIRRSLTWSPFTRK